MYYARKQQKRIHPLMLRRISLLVVIAAAAALFASLFFFTDVLRGSASLHNLDRQISTTTEGSASGMVSLSDGTLTLCDYQGKEVWTYAGDASLDRLSVSDDVICTYSDTTATFYDYGKTPLFSASMETPISRTACGKEYVAVQVTQKQEAATNSFIYVYDLTGTQTGTIELPGKQVLDFGMYGTADSVWALSLDTSGVVPISYITTYKADGTTTGSISINTQLLEHVTVTDTQIFASGTNTLASFSYFGEAQDSTLIYGWRPYDQSVSASALKMLYVTRESGALDQSAIYNVKYLDEHLNEIAIYFPEAVHYACVTQESIYAFANYNIYVYNNNGELQKTIEMDKPISAAKKISNQYAVVWDNETSYLLKLA